MKSSGRGSTPRLVAILVALPAFRCATIYSRGLVEDAAGAPVPGASVRMIGAGGGTVAAAITDAHGCFFLQRAARGDERRFTLEIAAPGFKTARLDVPREPPILLAALAPDSSAEDGGIRATTTSERAEKWEPRCIPLFPGGGAQELSPH